MRSRNTENGLETTIVTGTHVALISIRITDNKVNTPDFLGFEIKRDDLTENESYPLSGFKHFAETGTPAVKGQLLDTDKQPVQSFYWEDYSVKPSHDYKYHIIPVYDTPKNLKYGDEVVVAISSEKNEGNEHSVYFNMGVAGSLAYARRFNDKRPDQMSDADKAAARTWLSRGLEEALLGFIQKAIDNNYGLRTAFYEFTYPPVLLKLKEAVEKGLDVRIIYDSRQEEKENDDSIAAAGLQRTFMRGGVNVNVLNRRTKDPQVPSHNKFMILMDGENPIEIWTGSTNITDKGILGHSNVGHHVNNADLAKKYLQYWNFLVTDPDHTPFTKDVVGVQPDVLDIAGFTDEITPFFSPREDKDILKTYGKFIESAKDMVCGIFPFSFSKDMKASFNNNTTAIKYLLVDKYGNAATVKTDDNTLIVNGAYFTKPMFDWLEEINAGILLNKTPNPSIGTNYVHNKVLLIDPLSSNPTIAIGSANFSDPSVASNDENTMVIHGGKEMRRICDIYFTEFYRMFHHFFIRLATQDINKGQDTQPDAANNPLHLKTDNSWVAEFDKDKLKTRMQDQLAKMPLDY